jgi:hypothetical protein
MAQIETGSELATLYGTPTVLALKKDLDHVDAHARAFTGRFVRYLLAIRAGGSLWMESNRVSG